ncbi:KTSC domain-containing protein [Pseudoalteromonas aliena]|uniref:KTSC domain-containing protein n=1 Tax=Pseudoalteromonas aliena SW19 TaxID=1314866 RepID=A0ABR9E2E1_9GAMM|nr:KTSC domain-containing protein [Pseudoalteromonas aliena]MBE0360771.1 hypothetical protein [Pseudoalteromonas aliena SW19]
MKATYILFLLIFPIFTYGNYHALDRYCSKNIDNVRIFYVNGVRTNIKQYKANLNELSYFQDFHLPEFKKGALPAGSYNKSEAILMQIYEVAQQKYSDLPVFSPEYRIITAIIGGTVSSLSDIDIAQIESVLQDVFTEVNYSIIDETDYKNAFQRLQFQMHSCNRIILIGHSQGNFYTNALFEEAISTYQYSDGYLASDYPMVSLAAVATPTSSMGGSLGEEYKEIISHLTLDEDWVMRAVRVLFGSLPSNYSAESLFDSTGHGLIDSYLRNNAVANAISAGIKLSMLNQTPFPLFEQHPVNSSAFSHIGYSTINKILDLKFKSGSVYRYYNIPILLWDELYYSTSMGKFYNENIRGQYPVDKLDIENRVYLKMTTLEPVAIDEK